MVGENSLPRACPLFKYCHDDQFVVKEGPL